MNRRESLATLAAMSGALSTTLAVEPTNPIVEENKKPGTKDWMLTKTDVDPKTKYRAVGIEGFVSHSTIAAGETLSFYVSTNPA